MTHSVSLRQRLILLASLFVLSLCAPGIWSEARAQNNSSCFTIVDPSLECVRVAGSSDSIRYNFRFRVRNNQRTYSASAFNLAGTSSNGGFVGGTSSTISFSPALRPGTTDSTVRSVVLFGSGVRPGVTLRMTGRLVLLDSNRSVCTDTFSLRIPECPPPSNGCLDIVEQTIECRQTPTGPQWSWCFNVRNRASNSKKHISLTSSSGVTTNYTFNASVPPGGLSSRICVPITGAQAGQTITYRIRFCHDTVTYRDTVIGGRRIVIADSSKVCCDATHSIRLPECGTPPPACLSLLEQRVECLDSLKGGYVWCFNVRNNTSFTAKRIYVNNAVYTLSPALPPGATSARICVPLNGPGGTRVALMVRLCGDTLIRVRDSTIRQEFCCSDTASVLLPVCNTPPGCIDLVQPEISCRRDSSGAAIYSWCFNIRNLSGFPVGNVSILPSDPSITVSPSTFDPSPVIPIGGLSSRICVMIAGGRPGTSASFVVVVCDSLGRRCCFDTITVKLPECKEPTGEDCCSRFRKDFIRLTNSASSNGSTSLWGYLSAGPNTIKSVSATIVDARINGQPVAASFTTGLIRVTPGTVPYMHEFVWNATPAANLTGATLFNWRMRFPAMAPNARIDTLRYCIRVRFTDASCVTCDTVLCFTRVRYRFIGGPGGAAREEKEGGRIQSGGPTLGGALYNNDSGAVQIRFPAPPAELGAIRYVGLDVRADGVPVNWIGARQPGYSFNAMAGVGTGTFNASPGMALDLGLRYAGLGSRPTLGHTLAFRYVQESNPVDTLEEEVDLMLRRADLSGGDKLRPDVVDGLFIRTFALHLDNANPGKEPIHRLVINTVGGARILAVGPTSNPRRAVLEFATGINDSATQRYVGEVIGGQQVVVDPGATHGPIYVTLDGVDLEEQSSPIHFMTLNAFGQVVTEGEMTLSNTSTVGGGETGGSNGVLLVGSYPNPTSGAATIEFVLQRAESGVTLVVSDLSGREVARLIERKDLAAGQHAVYFNTAGLASGTYVYTLRTGSGNVSKSMVVTR